MSNIEDAYPNIITEVMKYIEETKNNKKFSSDNDQVAILDLIMDFCHKNNYEVEMVGDAIRSDTYFKSFIEKDCEINNFFTSERKNKAIDKW